MRIDYFLYLCIDFILFIYNMVKHIILWTLNPELSEEEKQTVKEGIKAGLIRPITLWPFPDKTIEKHVDHTKEFLCVEMNMGQMVDDVRLVVSGRKPVSFFGRTGGVIPTPAEVLDEIRKLAGKEN